MIIFDFDQTLVDTSTVESLRTARRWKEVMARVSTLNVYANISELLTDLSVQGHALAIVTKSPSMVPKWFIDHYRWPIDVLVGYHDVTYRKPHPEGLLKAMAKTGAEPGTSFHVGDQVQDTEAARAAGVTAIGVTWGISDDAALRASNPDRLFATVTEVRAFFGL